MNINLIDIAIVAIIMFSLFAGMHKGFISSGLSALGFAAAWFGALYLFPYVAESLQSNERFIDFLGYYLDSGSLFKGAGTANALVTSVLQDGSISQVIADIKLPEVLKTAFQQNVASQQFLSEGLNTLSQYLNATIIRSLINVTSFLAMFALSYIVALIFINLLDAVFHFPVLKHLDSLLGGVFGFARGALIVMLILTSIPIFEAVANVDFFDAMVEQSTVAPYFSREVGIPEVIQRAFQTETPRESQERSIGQEEGE